jgi:serine/threonine protein kinase
MANSKEGSDDRIGQKFGNYRIIQFLGRGGFADVYLGQHLFLKTQAAIKVLRTQLAEDDQEDFLKEAQMIAQLLHPNIVRVLEFGKKQDTDILFLVMDYAPHSSLRTRHKKGSLVSAPDVVPYVTQIAAALQYAHTAKLIHRDVKPENMLVGQNGTILLSDFGIAMSAPNTQSIHLEDVIGSLPYMAPEQWRGQPRFASDQYSLATCVYEWLTGGRPFKGSSSDIVAQLLSAEPLQLRSKNAQISPLVEHVVMKALSKEPKERYSSVEEFAQAFEQAVVEDEHRGHIAILSTKQPPPRDKRPPHIVHAPTRQPPIADIPTRQLPPSPMPQAPQTRQLPYPSVPLVPPTMQLPPPGTQVLSQSAPQILYKGKRKSISRRTFIGTFLGGAATLIVGSALTYAVSHHLIFHSPQGLIYSYPNITASVNAVSWYSGGWLFGTTDSIASAGDDNKVLLWDATTGNNLVTYSEHTTPVIAVAWSFDGTLVASAGTDNQVYIWNAANKLTIGSYSEHIPTPLTKPDFALAWSPKDLYVAFGGYSGVVYIQSSATEEEFPKWVGSGGPTDDFSSLKAVAWSPDGQQIVAGWGDGTIKVRDAFADRNESAVTKYNGSVFSLAWSPIDGSKSIAVAVSDQDKGNSVELWDITTRKSGISYQGHSGIIRCIAWSPEGQYIASAGDDASVHIWNANTGVVLYKYSGHTAPVTSVAWAGDSRRVVSASKDGSVQVWEAFKTGLF